MSFENRFWALIEEAVPTDGAGTDEHVAAIQRALVASPTEDVVAFHATLESCARRICHWDVWAVGYLAMGGCSDDAFDYFRMWIIAQGRAYFDAVVADPERAAVRIGRETDAECEILDYVAAKAYEEQTGDEFPYDMVDELIAAMPGAGSEGLQGEPFDEDGLDARFPTLAARVASWD